MEIWYFAYGSNLKRHMLEERIGEWKEEQRAILKGFTLSFAKGYRNHESGYANIKECLGSEVEGAVYLISEDQFRKLDDYEGVALGVYRRRVVSAVTEWNLKCATTYEMNKEVCSLRPSVDYLSLVLDGLREHGYDESTVKKVEAIAANASILQPLIPKKLAMGPSNKYGGPSLSDLKKEGITAIIDLTQDPEEMSKVSEIGLKNIEDPKLNIPDFRPIPSETLRYVVTQIHQLILRGHYLYLQSAKAHGRSPTIAAAYLICLGKEKNEAVNLVTNVRAGAWSGMDSTCADFLDEFEKTYRGTCVDR
jgi:gamma-glutamylcyclotransferase (GGCT)/AIG2-like uncharacterized protein YtfP